MQRYTLILNIPNILSTFLQENYIANKNKLNINDLYNIRIYFTNKLLIICNTFAHTYAYTRVIVLKLNFEVVF